MPIDLEYGLRGIGSDFLKIYFTMARKQRERSATGIYHVMLRGINKQDIFLDDNVFDSMLGALQEAQCQRTLTKASSFASQHKDCYLHSVSSRWASLGTVEQSEF